MSGRTGGADPRPPLGAGRPSRRWGWVGPLLVVVAGAVAYHNSFGGPFVFDDVSSIPNNPTIHSLWPLTTPLCPPTGGRTVSGRPVVNLSLAVNYAMGRLDVTGYHVLNLMVHLAAALVLYGIIRRTCLLPGMPPFLARSAVALATASATLWVLHPLTTAAVTYVIQRAEAIVALFYLLTVYAVLRGATGGASRAWYAAAVTACLLGAGSKEVIVTAPVAVLLYDRAFLAGSFRAAWRQRWGLYSALAATWVLLAWLIASTGGRGGTVGFDRASPPAYAMTQLWALARYLRLAFWPDPLTFDYGWALVESPAQIAAAGLLIACLLAGTVAALVRWPRAGFPAAAFFLILAPTSSIVPLDDPIFEHRAYLPLACVVVLCVAGWLWLLGRWMPAGPRANPLPRVLSAAMVVVVGVALGCGTLARNEEYRTTEAIWRSAVVSRPGNPRAHNSLGVALQDRKRPEEAIARFREALRIKPDYAEACGNLGLALQGKGLTEEAVALYREALRIKPDYAEAHNNWGTVLAGQGRFEEAAAHFERVVRVNPDHAEAHSNWGLALQNMGRFQDAIGHYREALRINPDLAEPHNNWGAALRGMERFEEAVSHYEKAVRIWPGYAEAHAGWGDALARMGRYPEAAEHLREALRLNAGLSRARENLRRVEAILRTRGDSPGP